MGMPNEGYECSHTPLTTTHLSIAWCSRCQHWLVHWSQSGRRDSSGGIVLIEHLKNETIRAQGSDPQDLTMWCQRMLLGVVETEHDRRDTDALRPAWRLRSV